MIHLNWLHLLHGSSLLCVWPFPTNNCVLTTIHGNWLYLLYGPNMLKGLPFCIDEYPPPTPTNSVGFIGCMCDLFVLMVSGPHHHSNQMAVFCFVGTICLVSNLVLLMGMSPPPVKSIGCVLLHGVNLLHGWVSYTDQHPQPTVNVNYNTKKASNHKKSYLEPPKTKKSGKKPTKCLQNWWHGPN